MSELSEEELMEISRRYHENREAIEALIEKQLREMRPQVLIGRDFGMTANQVHSRAKTRGIFYYNK